MEHTPRTPRAFSGIQPTGDLHLGNFLGALRNWVKLQENYHCVYCIVDLHALSVPRNPGEVRAASMEVARNLLAIGIDPEQSILFIQSRIKQHTELAWLMQCSAAFGELRRMTQFKDKSETNDFVSAALFTYPTLQAADILLYDTDVVPVGDDQRQHIEFTRDIAQRFNNHYGDVLVIPEHRIPAAGARIMDLQNPGNKMSKSAESPQGTVLLSDTSSQIAKKIKRAVTDNDAEVRFDPETKPGVSNMLSLLAAATDGDPVELAEEYNQYGPLKSDVADAVVALVEPIQKRLVELDDATVLDILADGEDRARAKATEVMDRISGATRLL